MKINYPVSPVNFKFIFATLPLKLRVEMAFRLRRKIEIDLQEGSRGGHVGF